MIIDLCVLLLVLLFGVFGYRTGFLLQLSRILALGAGLAAAWFLTPPLSELVANGLAVDPFLAGVAVFLAIFFLVSLGIGLAGSTLAKRGRSESAAFTFFDRGFGGLLGALKGIALVYVALALTWTLLPVIQKARPELDLGLERSLVAGEVRKHNLVQDEVFPRASAALKLLRLMEDPDLMQRAAAVPAFQERILSKPDAKALLDPRVLAAPPDQRWKLLVEDGRIARLLEDSEVVSALAEFDLEALRAQPPTAEGAIAPLPKRPSGPAPVVAPEEPVPSGGAPVEAAPSAPLEAARPTPLAGGAPTP